MVHFYLWNLHIILESLPISSSGHFELLRKIFGLNKQTAAEKYLMHIPTGIIVFLFLIPYYSLWLPLLGSIIIDDTITGLMYLGTKAEQRRWPLYLGFAISSISLLSLYKAPLGNLNYISPPVAVCIGLAQALALFPGVSRLTLTTVTGIWFGINPLIAFIFSLACELPLIGIAVLKAFNNGAQLPWPGWYTIALIISSVISYELLCLIAVAFSNLSVVYFGWYLCILASILCALSRKKGFSCY